MGVGVMPRKFNTREENGLGSEPAMPVFMQM